MSKRAAAPSASSRMIARLVQALSEPTAEGVLSDDRLVVQAKVKGVTLRRASFEREPAEHLVQSGAAQWTGRSSNVLVLTDAGQALARRLAAGEDAFQVQHRALTDQMASVDGETVRLSVNLKENPLLWLHRRRGRNEAPLIDDAAFAAGERFRSEFERAGMMQRTTIDWSRLGANTDGGGGVDASDILLSARARVRAALAAVGPELSGPIIDLVCFHKGLEQIEQERNWPARSGKLVIRLALAALARHYGYDNTAIGAANRTGVRAWQAGSPPGDASGLGTNPVHQ
jgi:hypothetical protein